LTDIGPGDGATTVIPGSHKAHEIHPTLAKSKHVGYDDDVVAGEQLGMQEVHLKAGQAVMFTDAITHGSSARTNEGQRRVLIYRYSPNCIAPRYMYAPSDELLARLTDERREIIKPTTWRMQPGRAIQSDAKGTVQPLGRPSI